MARCSYATPATFATGVWEERYLGTCGKAVDAVADSVEHTLYLLTSHEGVPFVQDDIVTVSTFGNDVERFEERLDETSCTWHRLTVPSRALRRRSSTLMMLKSLAICSASDFGVRRTPAGCGNMTTTTMAYFEIQCDDIERARRFYVTTFGLEMFHAGDVAVHRILEVTPPRFRGGCCSDRPPCFRRRPTNAAVISMESVTKRQMRFCNGGQEAMPKFAVPAASAGVLRHTEGTCSASSKPTPSELSSQPAGAKNSSGSPSGSSKLTPEP